MFRVKLVVLFTLISALAAAHAELTSVDLKLVGDRQIAVGAVVDGHRYTAQLNVPLSKPQFVRNERCKNLRLWEPKAGLWLQCAPQKIKSQECSTPHLLVPGSLVLSAGEADGSPVYALGKDFAANDVTGTFGRLEGGAIPAQGTLYISYSYAPQRYDSIVLTDGRIELITGTPAVSTPRPPELAMGQIRLANILTRGAIGTLQQSDLYPIRETAFPAAPYSDVAEQLLPRTLAKLRSGESLTILAWGDSVTDGGFVPADQRWPNQFVSRLLSRFPNARITLLIQAWPGHSSNSYLKEPFNSEHSFQTKVAEVRSDLVISEFVNDGWYDQKTFEENYSHFLKTFWDSSREWIILTPHYTAGMPESTEDSRRYVQFVRDFAAQNHIPLAEGSRRFGRLHLQGLSFLTLMTNSYNHPDGRGMALFADALIQLFPER